MRYLKKEPKDVVDFQLAAYEQMHGYQPTNIVRAHDEAYEYDWVEGMHCRQWKAVWDATKVACWDGDTQPIERYNREAYTHYVLCASIDTHVSASHITAATSIILRAPLTPVRMCHGDLTFANVILHPHCGVILIDPGCDRGLTCREMDESKLLQSLDGFDEAYRGWTPTPAQSACFWPAPIHWALLLTHYVRMLRHVNEVGQAFARRRIKEINEWLRAHA